MKSPTLDGSHRLVTLFQETLKNLGVWCHTSTTADSKTVNRRFEHEGISFLTISLPNFGKDFQKSLDQGYVSHDQFKGFAFSGGLPRLFGGFLENVFERKGGLLLLDPDIDAIRAIRQLTLMFGKVGLACSEERVTAAISGYMECENEVREFDKLRTPELYLEFSRMSQLVWGSVLQRVDEDIYYGRILPKHGPGATADRLLGNQKFNQVEWTRRLEEVFLSSEYLVPNARHYQSLERLTIVEPGAEKPARVITVPKTLKTPRIIAIEPTALQYMQQGIMECIVDAIERPFIRDDNRSWLVGFERQEPNQFLAQEGSLRGELATLDLSEASDRVSNQLVREMLKYTPNLAAGVDSSRSRKADVPGHGVIRLAKFASMGSALCFPIEAMVFSTIIFIGIQNELNRTLSKKDINSFKDKVRVYGDDIIVPVEYVSSVVSALQTFGFKVNTDKSFWTGKFRESCGKEYYDGHDVSVVRCRSLLPSSRKDVKEIVSTSSMRNQFYLAGMWEVCAWLDNIITEYIPYPVVAPTSPIIGRVSALGFETEKLHPTLHSPLVKGYVIRTVTPINSLDGLGALMKFFLKRGDLPFADREHLERSGRPLAVDIKQRWASPF